MTTRTYNIRYDNLARSLAMMEDELRRADERVKNAESRVRFDDDDVDDGVDDGDDDQDGDDDAESKLERLCDDDVEDELSPPRLPPKLSRARDISGGDN